MRTQTLTDPSELAAAWARQYERVAQIIANLLRNKSMKVAEIGCGSGQLTIPLAKHAFGARFVLVDTFEDPRTGSYSKKRYRILLSNLNKARLIGRAHIVVCDYWKWIRMQGDETYDAVISSEFLPELDLAETKHFIQECHRLLKTGSVTAHSFLSPIPRNHRQRLLIKADSNPIWTNTPPREWFSPRPELVTKELRKCGFQRIRKTAFRSNLIMEADSARAWLKRAQVKASFYERHKTQLSKGGLEVPDWVIVSGVKP